MSNIKDENQIFLFQNCQSFNIDFSKTIAIRIKNINFFKYMAKTGSGDADKDTSLFTCRMNTKPLMKKCYKV